MNHYGIPDRLEKMIKKLVKVAEEMDNFDPYSGRKLYSYCYNLGCEDIDVTIAAHHTIFGKLKSSDEFNWSKKIEAAGKKADSLFDEYENGYEGFSKEFQDAFSDEKRFTYTPLVCVIGRRPAWK